MFCAFCGGANPDDGVFCSHCAKPLRPDAPSAPPGQQPTQAMPGVPMQPTMQMPGQAQVLGPYTCAVCGYVLGPTDTSCARCKTARGMKVDPAAPLPGTYAPVGGAYAFYNTSGQKGDVPAEIRGGWNWGAFLFRWIWGLNHRSYITLIELGVSILSAIPSLRAIGIVSLGLMIWFGVKGNEWGWQNRRFESVDHFRKVQRVWGFWGLGCFLVWVVIVVIGVILVVAVAASNPRAFSSGQPFGQ